MALPTETEWVEFKVDDSDPEATGRYLSALSNSAALHGQPFGYIVWGVEDGTHHVVGTGFRPKCEKAKGNEDLVPWLSQRLNPRVDFAFYDGAVGGERVVLLSANS